MPESIRILVAAKRKHKFYHSLLLLLGIFPYCQLPEIPLGTASSYRIISPGKIKGPLG